ncbi:MAG: response regulator [Fibromonadaceae bacterium]|jgi:signal transduction histidine kinase/DNA-binding response OmpR family regulator|nr:response regulator [Fibromonadaceae bacterium]
MIEPNKKRTRVIRSVFKQLLFVWLAFFLMTFISYLFVKNIVNDYLTKEAKNALTYTQSKIATDLLQAETSLQNITQSIRTMILRGNSANVIQEYLTEMTKYLMSNDTRVSGFSGVYGVFDVFKNEYLDGTGTDWIPKDYNPKERPWYKAAVAAGTGVAATAPYVDAQTGEIIISYSECILDNKGKQLGVVSMDLLLDRIMKYVIDTRLTEGGYGILLNENLELIASPTKENMGKHLSELPYKGISDIVNNLKNGIDISEHKIIIDDRQNSEFILFTKRFENGWNMGILTPKDQYYQKVKKMRLFIALLCVFLAAALSFILFSLSVAKQKSDEKNQLAEAASKAKSDFLAKMSHEIRTPMNAIIGMAEMALREYISDAAREHLITIKKAGSNLLSIINDILDFSKIESGKLEIIQRNYLFSSLINDVVSIIKMRIVDSNLSFVVNIDPNVPNSLFGDEIRIRQVLLNILSNAVKYTKKGFISFSVNGEITGDTVILTIEVTDSGIGIKKEDLEKLFDDFVRFDFAVNKDVEGTGLGLAITKNLIKMMNGNISVQSEYGKGSTFTVKLPQKIRSRESFDAIKSDSVAIKFNAPKARILIVDDIDTNLKVAKGLMLPYKMQIDLCSSGIEAIERIKANDYDLVFMDHMMPEMDGIEATKLIRKTHANLPIIALTANAVSGTKEMFLSNGFSDFLSKPIDIIKLNSILEKWLPEEKQEKMMETAHESLNVNLEILDTFHKDGLKKIKEIKECLETDNYHLYTIYIHALKSASASVGALDLSEMAKLLEMAGKQGDFTYIKHNTSKFLTALENLLDNINATLLENKRNEQEGPVDFEALKVELNKLKEAIGIFDSDAIDKATTSLRAFTQVAEVENILQKTLTGEYDEVVAIIDNLAENTFL